MKNIEIRLKRNLEKTGRLYKLQEKAGLISEDIARKLAEDLEGTTRSWATLYSTYRNGSKNIPARVIPVLAKILNTTPEEIKKINNGREAGYVVLIPSDMSVTPLLEKFRGKSVTAADLVLELQQLCQNAETEKLKKALIG